MNKNERLTYPLILGGLNRKFSSVHYLSGDGVRMGTSRNGGYLHRSVDFTAVACFALHN